MKLSEYKSQLLEKVSKSQLLKENLTISEMESLKEFIKNLTKEQATCIMKRAEEAESDEEEGVEDIDPMFKQTQQKNLDRIAGEPQQPATARWPSYMSKSKVPPSSPNTMTPEQV